MSANACPFTHFEGLAATGQRGGGAGGRRVRAALVHAGARAARAAALWPALLVCRSAGRGALGLGQHAGPPAGRPGPTRAAPGGGCGSPGAPWRDWLAHVSLRLTTLTLFPSASALLASPTDMHVDVTELTRRPTIRLYTRQHESPAPKRPCLCGQSAPALLDAQVQATGEPLRRNCSQYAPRELSADARAAVLASADFASFLQCIRPRCAPSPRRRRCQPHFHAQGPCV
jgi:hypothetical protein